MNKVILGNNKEVLKTFADNSIDSIVTDPPYELGFMGKKWDSTGIAYDVELWQECLRVLKPGGHLLAFSGTRTYHRMAVAIEDAGFEVRDMIEWIYGSGFPKSLNIGKAVDKLQGNEREDLGENKNQRINKLEADIYEAGIRGKEARVTRGSSPYEGWGTALKPAHEPICMARKSLSEKNVALNVLKWGTGGINIDESRVGTEDTYKANGMKSLGVMHDDNWQPKEITQEMHNLGRFPSNLIHDGSDEVKACFPDESERFFKSIIYQAKASKAERNRGCEGLEEKQYSHDGREKEIENAFQRNKSIAHNNHPTVKPIALMAYLIKMVTPKGGVVLDPFAGSGSTLVAAKEEGFEYVGIDITPEYIEIINARLAAVTPQQKLF